MGLLLTRTAYPGNPFPDLIPAHRDGSSSGQSQLTERFFYEPIFNQLCAAIERRGNPIDDAGTIRAAEHRHASPSRYATITYYDYQKDAQTTVDTHGPCWGFWGWAPRKLNPSIRSSTAN